LPTGCAGVETGIPMEKWPITVSVIYRTLNWLTWYRGRT